MLCWGLWDLCIANPMKGFGLAWYAHGLRVGHAVQSAAPFSVSSTVIADTPIVSTGFKLFMAGIPLTPVSRIGGAIFKAATDADPETNGAVYTLPDDGETFRLNHTQLTLDEGVYKTIKTRARRVQG
jgi:hypothetical protein